MEGFGRHDEGASREVYHPAGRSGTPGASAPLEEGSVMSRDHVDARRTFVSWTMLRQRDCMQMILPAEPD